MRNPYTVLGVSATATAEDIKSAYRQLAKTWHPDQNQDDPNAGNRFSEIAHAYKLLIDPDLRLKFDSGQIDARGRRKTKAAKGFTVNPFSFFRQAARATADAGASESAGPGSNDAADVGEFEDMVAHIFGDAAHKHTMKPKPGTNGRRTEPNAPGIDEDPLATLDALFEKWKSHHKAEAGNQTRMPATRHVVEIDLEAALSGYRGEFVFGDTHSVAFATPPGTPHGCEVRIASPKPDAYGDAILTIRHKEHPLFRASGPDLHAEHALELADAVLGGTFTVKTLDGPVQIRIPQWSGSDAVVAVAGYGLPDGRGARGILHVHIRVMLPEEKDPRLIELMRSSRKTLYV